MFHVHYANVSMFFLSCLPNVFLWFSYIVFTGALQEEELFAIKMLQYVHIHIQYNVCKYVQ